MHWAKLLQPQSASKVTYKLISSSVVSWPFNMCCRLQS